MSGGVAALDRRPHAKIPPGWRGKGRDIRVWFIGRPLIGWSLGWVGVVAPSVAEHCGTHRSGPVGRREEFGKRKGPGRIPGLGTDEGSGWVMQCPASLGAEAPTP